MSKWIKNADTVNHTYASQLILPGEYYQILSTEHAIFAQDSALIADIASGIAVMAKDDSGNTDISDINQAIDFLKDNLPRDVKLSESATLSGVKDPKGMRARLVGIINTTITAGQTVDCDWVCPQLQWLGVNKPSYFDGIEYYAENAKVGDTAKFQVVDKDGVGVLAGWYTQAQFDAMGNLYVVEEFGDAWAMMPNQKNNLSLYKAAVVPGLYIRLKYVSTGNTNVNLVVNLFRHMDAT